LRSPFQIISAVFLLLLASSLLFTGCTRHPQPLKETTPSEPSTISPTMPLTMYVKNEIEGFKQGERVTVVSIDGPMAMTTKGEVLLSDLEEQRSTFRLTVHAPDAATVRILNIKPKYSSGMWLSAGNYHLEISKPGYQTYRQWVEIARDEEMTVTLKRNEVAADGSISWQKKGDLFAGSGMLWYRSADKMTWETAKDFCDDLAATAYSYHITGFTLPTDDELLQLFNTKGSEIYPNPLFWSSTTDPAQESYAKYVNVNSGENSWYKKHGKTYVMCAHPLAYTQQYTVYQLAYVLMNETTGDTITPLKERLSENEQALNALEMALLLKYGNPVIQNVHYLADRGQLIFEIVSQNRSTEGRPFFSQEVSLDVEPDEAVQMQAQLMDPAFEPIVEFEVTNGRLRFNGI